MPSRPFAFVLLTGSFLALSSPLTAAERTAAFPKPAPGDWPWWRGPAWDGTSTERQPPLKWNMTTNMVWKTDVPGLGHSSPVVVGDRIFLTTADEKAQKQFILAFDRRAGKPLWRTLAHEGGFMPKNPTNSHASATPACDGDRVYSAFINGGALHVTATDLDGKILWQKRVGDFTSEHGYGSSPVLYRSLVIVNGDSLKGSFVAALDRQTGDVAWHTDRKSTGRHGSYATPRVATVAGKPQLILTGMNEVTSYEPETGKRIWSCAGPAEVTACTAACSDDLVFATGGFPERELLAIRADGTGDVTKSNVVWRTGKGATYVPSPVYHDGRLYVVTGTGTATCFDAATGKPVWQDRLPDGFSASPILAGDRLHAAGESGKTFVLKAGPKFEVLAVNDLRDGIMATPAVCGGKIYLRTSRQLYCIGDAGGKP